MAEAVFLSASIPDPRHSIEFATTADTVAITAAVAALVHVVLGRRVLVWGGHPAITPMVFAAAEALDVDYGSWVKLYQSRYFEDEFPEDNARFHNVTFTPLLLGDRASSLRTMREQMVSHHQFCAAVFIGGMSGIFDEFDLFRRIWPGVPVVPVISTGGAALVLGERMQSLKSDLATDLDYVALFHRHLAVSVKERRYARPDDQPADVNQRFWPPDSHT